MDDGVFVLNTGLKTGEYDIYAFKPGIDIDKLQGLLNDTELGMLENKVPNLFKRQDSGYVSHISTVQLEQGKLTTLNVQLKSSNAISGRVTNSAGNAVPDVAVFAFDSGIGIGSYVVTASFGSVPVSSSVEVPAVSLANIVLDFGEITIRAM